MASAMVAGQSTAEMFIIFSILLAERTAFRPDGRLMATTAGVLVTLGIIKTFHLAGADSLTALSSGTAIFQRMAALKKM